MLKKLFCSNLDKKNNLDEEETKNININTELINEDKIYKYLACSEEKDLIDEECNNED